MPRPLRSFLILVFCSVVVDGINAAEKPNVIVIFTDDHGYADLSCQGVMKDVRTPNIDQLARGGVRMSAGYVTAPQCVPSRAGLLTGRYQNRFGVESNGVPLAGFNAETTIAERLKQEGYATGMTGKWHLGPPPEIVKHGFQDVYYKNANHPGWANFDLDGQDREAGPEDSKLYHLEANSAAACAFIDRHHQQPFFFYCAYRAPHVPLDAPAKYLQRFPGEMPERRRQALAMLSAIDDGVGQILTTLRRHGLEENTLIFLIGDNGAPLKIHKLDAPGGGPGWDGSVNDPLNGEKGMLTEGGIRVPFLAYWKGRIPPGQVYDHPVISLDVAATALAIAGVETDPKLDGVNLLPYLTGENKSAPHAQLYWRWIAQAAVREGRWKYLRGGTREYLFDLDADPEEHDNLAAKHLQRVRDLRGKLEAWSNELSPPGLATSSMTSTWDEYYNHYLEGKSSPPPRNRPVVSSNTKDWSVRGGRIVQTDNAWIIHPTATSGRLFLAASGLKLPAQLTVTVQMKTSQPGTAGFQWRELGQKEFLGRQAAMFDCQPSDDMQLHKANIRAAGNIIHLRFLLPDRGAEISSLTIQNATGDILKSWDFRKE